MSEQPSIQNENQAKLQEQGLFNQGYIENLTIQQKSVSSKKLQIDWSSVCQQVLKQQKDLRRPITERGCELNIYVPLGLVERKQQQRHKETEDSSREKVDQLEEIVITKQYEHDAFLKEIIGEHNLNKKQIAIIGEPGAGKTTLLYKIATWIEGNNKGLPIFVPLGALEGKKLEEYLLKDWLKKAENYIPAEDKPNETALQEALKQRFRDGEMWLLLDGLDEMAANASGGVLTTIKSYLDGWVNQAKIVLSSRVNVWDENKSNPLSNFQTYRTLSFNDEQVKEFITEWFRDAERLETASKLQTELEKPQYQSIQEMIHNPLRVAMLCEVWYNNPDQLPDTKAQLYERYIRDYYREWKHEQHQIKWDEQQKLNRKPGELALVQLNSEVRFRIKETIADQVMGLELFQLVCRIGWLNIVDRDTGTDEAVYAFFHASFQEYFAATAIEDWDYFVPRQHKNKPVVGKEYRIFEPKWKEVILLWLGRKDIKEVEKEAFIEKLITFDDGCVKWEGKGLYGYHAYFLAAAGMAEFKDCIKLKEIIRQIVNWNFHYFFNQIKESANAVLLETNRQEAINVLTELIRHSHDKYPLRRAAECLWKIDLGNETAINVLASLTCYSQDEYIHRKAEASLEEQIRKGDEKAINVLADLIRYSQDEYIHQKRDETAIYALVNLIRNSQDEDIRWQAAENLSEIDPGNETAINALVNLIRNSQDEDTRREAAKSLGKIGQRNETAINVLIDLIRRSQDEWTRLDAAESLVRIDPGNEIAINCLIDLIRNSQNVWNRWRAVGSLEEIISKSQMKRVVSIFRKISSNIFLKSIYRNNLEEYSSLLWKCVQNLSYFEFYQAWPDRHNPTSSPNKWLKPLSIILLGSCLTYAGFLIYFSYQNYQ